MLLLQLLMAVRLALQRWPPWLWAFRTKVRDFLGLVPAYRGWQFFVVCVCVCVTEVSTRLSLASSTAPGGLFHLDKEAWSIPYATGS